MDQSSEIAKFSEKQTKELEKFISEKIEKNFIDAISKYCSQKGFPVITADGTDETQEKIKDFIYNEVFKSATPKKASPKKAKNTMLTHEQYEEKVIEEKKKGNGVCPVIPSRGQYKNDFHCGIIVVGASGLCQSEVRCEPCKKKNNMNPTKGYFSRDIGSSVTVTLSPSFNSPVDQEDKEDSDSNGGDPVAAYLTGNTKGIMSPSLAVTKDESESEDEEKVKPPAMTKIKKTTKFCDYRYEIEDMVILIRETNGKHQVGGKFVGIKKFTGAYLEYVKELSESELSLLEKYKLSYKFLGTGEEDNDDDELAALLDELPRGN